ncbi:MAG: hypothetical protein Kow0059_01360 [Candidatus Sumerlaeia bacterium]
MPRSDPSAPIALRDLTALLLGHYEEMALPAVLTAILFLLLPHYSLEYLALVGSGILYAGAAARVLGVRHEPLMELARDRGRAQAATVLLGMALLIACYLVVFFIMTLMGLFAGFDMRGGAAIAAMASLAGAYVLVSRYWPFYAVPFVVEGRTDALGRWAPPPLGDVKLLLKDPRSSAAWTQPMLRAFTCYVVIPLVLRHVLPAPLSWLVSIGFVFYTCPIFNLAAVQLTHDFLNQGAPWLQSPLPVEAPPPVELPDWRIAAGPAPDADGPPPVPEGAGAAVADFDAAQREPDAARPAAEEEDAASGRKVKVFDFTTSKEPRYTLYGMQVGGPSPTPPGHAPPHPPVAPAADHQKSPAGTPPLTPPPARTARDLAIEALDEEPDGDAAPPPQASANSAPSPSAAPLSGGFSPSAAAAAEKGGGAEAGVSNTTVLQSAVDSGDLEGIRRLVSFGADPNVIGTDGLPLLHRAVKKRSLAVVESLLTSGAAPDQRDSMGRTALLHALSDGQDAMAELLLQHGADPCAVDLQGRSALMLAIQAHPSGAGASLADVPIIRRLLNSGADVRAATPRGETALHLAARRGDLNFVNALFFAGADVNAATADGITPLREALQSGHRLVADRLRMWGAVEES